MRRILACVAILSATTMAGCGKDQGPGCILQMNIVTAPTLAVGDTSALQVFALPMLPPGYACGQPTVTWSLSDSSLASIVSTGQRTATLTGLHQGVVTVTAHGTAAGHQADASMPITITASP